MLCTAFQPPLAHEGDEAVSSPASEVVSGGEAALEALFSWEASCEFAEARREICEAAKRGYASIKTGADLRQLGTVPFHFERGVGECCVCLDHDAHGVCLDHDAHDAREMWRCCLCDMYVCHRGSCLHYHACEAHYEYPESDVSSDFEDAWDDTTAMFAQWRYRAEDESALWSVEVRADCGCEACGAF